MTKEDALTLLDNVRDGYPATIAKINEALLKTGDLDVFVKLRQHSSFYSEKDLFKPGPLETKRLDHAMRYWAADRKA